MVISYGWRSIYLVRSSRSAIPKNHTQFLNHSLMVEHLINPVDNSWNVDLLNAYFHLDDVKIIRGLAVSRS